MNDLSVNNPLGVYSASHLVCYDSNETLLLGREIYIYIAIPAEP